MYYLAMKRENLKELLNGHYSKHMTDSILVGRRKPKIEVISEAQEKLKVPVIAWVNIKEYLNK